MGSNVKLSVSPTFQTQNSNADGLSRLSLATKTLPVPVPGESIFPLSIVNETPINASRIAQLTTRDPVLSKVGEFREDIMLAMNLHVT